MADKLTYKGGTSVVNKVGSGMTLVRPKNASVHKFPKWWNKGPTVSYFECAIFKVALDNGESVRLIVPHSIGMTFTIIHDGAGNFTFPNRNVVDRVAVVEADSTTVLVEYQFSKISGGSVLKRTVNALPTPPPPPSTTVDSVTVSGNETPDADTEESYSVSATGDATPYTYTWGIAGGVIDSGQGTTSATVTWGDAGAGSISCQVGSTNGNFDGNSVTDNLDVTIS